MEVRNYGSDNYIHLPVSGGGSAIVKGALLKRGATPATMNGQLRPATGNNVSPYAIGILQEAHATAADTDVAGTIFTTHPVDLVCPFRVVRVQYSLASADLITCTQAVSTATLTLTNLEDDIDSAFLYVGVGAGIGQTNYLTAAASGSCTLKAAFGTNLDTTSKLLKILPRFHQFASFTSDGTKLSSQDIVGASRVLVLDSLIVRDSGEDQLNPTKHSALTGLNGLGSLKFFADLAIVDSGPYTLA